MKAVSIRRVGNLLVLVGVMALTQAYRPQLRAEEMSPTLVAAQEFANNCSGCHGPQGKGDGPVSKPEIWATIDGIDRRRMPRDYTRDYFRFGDFEAEIMHTISTGSPGTAMTGFKAIYPPPVIQALARIVLQFRGSLTNEVIRSRHPERIPADLKGARGR